MNSTDFLSWLLAIVIVGTILAGAFFALVVLGPDSQSIELRAPEYSGGAAEIPEGMPQRRRGYMQA